MGVENKKAVKSDPGEKTPQLVADALPHSGSGSGLTAHLPWFSHLAMFALYHAMSGCAIPELRSGFSLGWVSRSYPTLTQRKKQVLQIAICQLFW